MLFNHVLLVLIVLFLLKQYEIVGHDQSQQGCSTYIQIHCECSCAFEKNCVTIFVPKYMFETNLYSSFVLGIFFRILKVYWHFCKTVSHPTHKP
jgi:hypothetical protein